MFYTLFAPHSEIIKIINFITVLVTFCFFLSFSVHHSKLNLFLPSSSFHLICVFPGDSVVWCYWGCFEAWLGVLWETKQIWNSLQQLLQMSTQVHVYGHCEKRMKDTYMHACMHTLYLNTVKHQLYYKIEIKKKLKNWLMCSLCRNTRKKRGD